jgi:hypothetical protein
VRNKYINDKNQEFNIIKGENAKLNKILNFWHPSFAA